MFVNTVVICSVRIAVSLPLHDMQPTQRVARWSKNTSTPEPLSSKKRQPLKMIIISVVTQLGCNFKMPKDTHTHTQTDRQTDRQTHRETETDRQTDTETDRQTRED